MVPLEIDDVMLNIRTHRGEGLSEVARVHYDRAMDALREAGSRHWVFQAEEWRTNIGCH